jgi:protease-4
MSYTDEAAYRRARRKLRFWRIAAAVTVVVVAIVLIVRADMTGRAHVARLSVEGIIVEDGARDRALIELGESGALGLIVHINSPGGTVVGGEDLYRGIERLREKMPVAVVMGTLATSGGYMAALAGDRIFAREGTLTGSIGVLIQSTDFTELLERIGIRAEAIKSSPLKAQPSPLEPFSEQAREATQTLIDDMY